jgi:tRNA pseudouridine32 synthase/23S rRNA pseudouridine746 synthase
MILEQRALVPAELAGERLDRAIAALFGRSRGWARRVAELGGVYLGGSRVRMLSRAVAAGDQLFVCWADPEEPEPAPLLPEAVLHTTHGWVAVNKPAGIHCQAARHRVRGTLPDLAARLLGDANPPEPVHRLDRGTSGVVLLARTAAGRRLLAAQWREETVGKRYVGLVAGVPVEDEGRITLRLGPDSRFPGGMRVAQGNEGQAASTRWRCLARADGYAMLLLEPETGRTHQLRVHCAASGWPILGDTRYAPQTVAAAPRLALHAWQLLLPLAVRAPRPLVAPLPQNFLDLVRHCGLGAGIEALASLR